MDQIRKPPRACSGFQILNARLQGTGGKATHSETYGDKLEQRGLTTSSSRALPPIIPPNTTASLSVSTSL
jgi:hypothetical protein